MPYLDKVVTELNNFLKAGKLNRHAFQGGVYHGLSKQVRIVDTDNNKMYPAILDKDGNDIDVTIDDASPIHAYHRLTQALQFNEPTSENQFGDAGQVIQEVATMAMVVLSDPKRTGILSDDLAFLIASGLPRQFTINQIGASDVASCIITLLNIETNPYTVLNQEYGSMNKTIDPTKTLLSVNYRIAMNVDKNCMACEDC